MNRKLAVVPTVLALGLSLAACSGSESTTLTMWTPLTGDDGAYMQEIVDAYNETDPDYTIEFQAVPELYTRISTAYNAGEGLPQFAILHAPNVQDLGPAGILEPVDAWIEAQPELTRENYLDVAWDGAEIDGAQYGVPLDMHGVIGYYNVDLVEEYGADAFLEDGMVTVEELLTLEGQLPDGVYAFPGLFIPGLVATWVYNQGGSFEPEGGVDVTAPEYQAAYEALVELQERG